MKYWGVTNYLFSRFYENDKGTNKTLSRVVKCPAPPARCESFASLGDTLNMINTNLTKTEKSGYAERCDGEGKDKVCYKKAAFNSNWAFVMSSSETVAEKVSEDLIKQGVIDHVNVLKNPGSLLKLPTEQWENTADTLNILFRVAFPKS